MADEREWRPKKEIWDKLLLKEVEKVPDPELLKGDLPEALLMFAEAGADAIVRALKENAIAQWESHHLMPGGKGWLVFIPDRKEAQDEHR